MDRSTDRIVGGDLDAVDTSVVMLIIQEAKNPTTSDTCTGTVVSPHVVLTAAHCLDERVIGKGKSVFAFLGDDSDSASQLGNKANFGYPASVHPHPEFDPATATTTTRPAHDVGVLILLDALKVAPIAMHRSALASDAVGRSLHLVGYGLADSADAASSGKRRQTDAPLVGFDDEHVWTAPPLHGTCGGDSGGPVLLKEGGEQVVLGVASWVEHVQSCTGKGYATRVDAYAAWIDAFIRQADPGFLAADDAGASEDAAPEAGEVEASTPPAAAPTDASPGTPAVTQTITSCAVAAGPGARTSSPLFGLAGLAAMLTAFGARRMGPGRG